MEPEKKYVVIKEFIDKHTKEHKRVGSRLTLKASRGLELEQAGYIEPVEKKKTKNE